MNVKAIVLGAGVTLIVAGAALGIWKGNNWIDTASQAQAPVVNEEAAHVAISANAAADLEQVAVLQANWRMEHGEYDSTGEFTDTVRLSAGNLLFFTADADGWTAVITAEDGSAYLRTSDSADVTRADSLDSLALPEGVQIAIP